MAFAQLFHQAAYMLSAFDIRPEVDAKGNLMFPTPEFVGEMVRLVIALLLRPIFKLMRLNRHPKPFQCVITPRWKDAHLLFEEAKTRSPFLKPAIGEIS